MAIGLKEQSQASVPSPAAGEQYIYLDSADDKLKRKDENGSVFVISAPQSTDELSEGVTNLYFTDARARAAAVENLIDPAHTNIAPSGSAVNTALALKADISSMNGSFANFLPISNGSQGNQYMQMTVVSNPGATYEIDWANTKQVIQITLDQNLAVSHGNKPPAGTLQAKLVKYIEPVAGSITVTHSGVVWGDVGAPSFNTNGSKANYVLLWIDDGSIVHGASVQMGG